MHCKIEGLIMMFIRPVFYCPLFNLSPTVIKQQSFLGYLEGSDSWGNYTAVIPGVYTDK